MPHSLPITRQFFEGCCNRDYPERRLILMKDMPEHTTRFVYNNSEQLLEIVIFKSTFKEIFEECHPVLEEFLASGQVVTDEESLAKIYLMTVGLMLTTNENHSVISIHTDIVTRILDSSKNSRACVDLILDPSTFLLRELYFIRTLLNSNIAKINKSSSLWTLFTKIFIHVVDNSSAQKLPNFYFFLNTSLVSAQMHPSNYYAWNFLTFMNNVSKLWSKCTFFIKCKKDIEQFCKKNLNDASAWSCLTNLIELNPAALKMTAAEFNKHSRNYKLEYQYQVIAVSISSPRDELMELSKWLWKSQCVSEVPYHAFGRLLLYTVKFWQDRLLVRQLMEQVVVHCALLEQVWFKQKGISVVVKNGYFTTNLVDLDSDLILKQRVQTYANWKRLLNWHTEFIFDRYMRDTLEIEGL